MSVDEIRERLNLRLLEHRWELYGISAISGEGLYEALDWLALQLGSAQVKKTSCSESHAKKSQTAEAPCAIAKAESSCDDRFQHRTDYCNRAYSRIKCLFHKTNRQSTPDK
ncbi:hypothetical protein ScPMuIL_008593 [Solemya velum]